MDLRSLRKNWDAFADADPLFAVLSWPEKRGRRWGEKEFFRTGVEEVRGVLRYLRGLKIPLRRRRALDFGCGVGRLTRAFAPHFKEVTGVDLSERMIGLAQGFHHRPGKCRFVHNPATDLRLFPDGRFDLVYSNLTLQHMAPRYSLAYIREFVRVLAPGGVVLFQVPAAHRPGTFGGKVKSLVKAAMPGPLRAPYRWYQERILGRPVVEMNPVPKSRVLRELEGAGARVLDVREDPNAGPEWPGYRYCALKVP